MKYGQIYEGEWVRLYMRDQTLGCCDCHLVHVINFRKTKRGLEAQFFRDNRATAAKRRGLKIVHE